MRKTIFIILTFGMIIGSIFSATASAGPLYPNDDKMQIDSSGTPDQDNFRPVGGLDAREINRGKGVQVAVIDSGCKVNHTELLNKVIDQRDFIYDDNVAQDTRNHGTRTASIIAGNTNNNFGIASFAPNAKILCAKVQVTGNEDVTNQNLIDAIKWADVRGADVYAFSLGTYSYSSDLEDLISDLSRTDIFVSSVGNSGSNISQIGDEPGTQRYPCSYNGVICVSALSENGSRFASWSSYGSAIDLAAPGENIWAACAGGTERYICSGSGTSFASPHVSAEAVLMKSLHPGWLGNEIRSAMFRSADDLGTAGRDNRTGHGRIDMDGALRQAR